MTRRRLTRLALVLAACGAGLLATPAPVQAATLEQQGWWFRLRPAGLPSELPSRPDVAEGQLVVEGAPDEAVAVSAVRFALADGESSPVLTLNVVDHVGTPDATVVLACAATSAWAPAEGGAWDDRAYPDCTTSVEGAPNADGTTWTFPLTALMRRTTVDVVLVPGKIPNGPDPVSGSTFRLVLDQPTVTTTGGTDPSTSTPPPPTIPSSGSSGGSAITPPPARAPGNVATPRLPTPAVSAPPMTTAGRPSTPAPPTTAAAPGTAPASTSGSDDRPRWLGGLLMAAAVAAAFATDRVPGLRTAGAGEETVGGLGRYARTRSGPPPRLV